MTHFQYSLAVASIALAISGLVVGLLAAQYWYKSSQVPPDPGWSLLVLSRPDCSELHTNRLVEIQLGGT